MADEEYELNAEEIDNNEDIITNDDDSSIEATQAQLIELSIDQHGRQTSSINQGEHPMKLDGLIHTINESGDVVPLKTNLDETIGTAIARAVPGNEKNFEFQLKDGTKLDSNKTLRDAGIEIGSTVRLVEVDSGYNSPKSSESEDEGIFFINETNGDVREMSVEKSDTVEHVISEVVGPENSTDYDLTYEDRAITPPTLVLRNAVPFGSRLRLREREIDVYVRTHYNNRNEVIRTTRSATVQEVKEKIREFNQVPIHQQHLQYQSNSLENTKTLRSYGIQNGSQLESTCKLRGGAS